MPFGAPGKNKPFGRRGGNRLNLNGARCSPLSSLRFFSCSFFPSPITLLLLAIGFDELFLEAMLIASLAVWGDVQKFRSHMSTPRWGRFWGLFFWCGVMLGGNEQPRPLGADPFVTRLRRVPPSVGQPLCHASRDTSPTGGDHLSGEAQVLLVITDI